MRRLLLLACCLGSPALAKELTTEMRRYDEASKRRVAQIEQDFTVNATCAADAGVREALMTMPTL